MFYLGNYVYQLDVFKACALYAYINLPLVTACTKRKSASAIMAQMSKGKHVFLGAKFVIPAEEREEA